MNIPKLAINIALTVAILVLGYLLYAEIAGPVKFANSRDSQYAAVEDRLEDIRNAQDIYRAVTGHYAESFENLEKGITQGEIPQVTSIGRESDTVRYINFKRAVKVLNIDTALSREQKMQTITDSLQKRFTRSKYQDGITIYVVKDTTMIPAINRYQELVKTPLSDLKYIPNGPSGATFEMQADIMEQGPGRIKVPVYEVIARNKDILHEENPKFYDPKEGLILGSLTESSTSISEFYFDADEIMQRR